MRVRWRAVGLTPVSSPVNGVAARDDLMARYVVWTLFPTEGRQSRRARRASKKRSDTHVREEPEESCLKSLGRGVGPTILVTVRRRLRQALLLDS